MHGTRKRRLGWMARHRLGRESPSRGSGSSSLRSMDVPWVPFDHPAVRQAFERFGQIVFGDENLCPRDRRRRAVTTGGCAAPHGGERSPELLALPLPELRSQSLPPGSVGRTTNAFPLPVRRPRERRRRSSAGWEPLWSSPTVPRFGKSSIPRESPVRTGLVHCGRGIVLCERAFRCERVQPLVAPPSEDPRRSACRGHFSGGRRRPLAAQSRDHPVLGRDDPIPEGGAR